jgi:hypothetical protein
MRDALARINSLHFFILLLGICFLREAPERAIGSEGGEWGYGGKGALAFKIGRLIKEERKVLFIFHFMTPLILPKTQNPNNPPNPGGHWGATRKPAVSSGQKKALDTMV